MSKINYKLTTIDHIEYKVPKICPICHMPQNPEILDTRTSADYLEVQVETILLAKCTNCNKYYLLPYSIIGRNEDLTYETKYSPYKQTLNIDLNFPEEIYTISERFVEIYRQSLTSEKLDLNELSGMGFRKSVEFLIKDYLIKINPDQKDKISSMHLGNAINKIDNENIKSLAKTSNMLANDQVHYTVKYSDKDINDLKSFIKALIYYISMEMTLNKSNEFLESLDKKKSK